MRAVLLVAALAALAGSALAGEKWWENQLSGNGGLH